MIGVVWPYEKVNIHGCCLVGRWRNSKFNVRNEQLNVGNSTANLVRLHFGIVSDRHVIGNAYDTDGALRLYRLHIAIPIAEVIIKYRTRRIGRANPICTTVNLWQACVGVPS